MGKMGWIKRILYGFLIGIAAIAPGLSGATIAIALGFYEDLISSVADLFKNFRKNFLFLLPFGLGTVASIASLSVVINYLFIRCTLEANLLFIGFILSTLPFIRKKLKSSLGKGKFSFSHLLILVSFFIIVLIPLRSGRSLADVQLSADPLHVLMLLLVGVIAAATLVVPGLSGTMILTAIGFYKPLLSISSAFVTAAVQLDFRRAAYQLIFIVPLGTGLILGVFLIAKLIRLLFEKLPAYVYSAIIGLIFATPIVMLASVKSSDISLLSAAVGLAALAAGFLSGHFLGDEKAA